jgi:hypothetical protein
MHKMFTELARDAERAAIMRSNPNKEYSEAEFKQTCANLALLKEMMSTNGKYRGPRINLSEALMAPDASILFPKVISDVMLRPKEPMMIGQTLLMKTVKIDNVRSVEFPSMGAIRAFDMSEGQEYREQLPSFTENLTEIKVNKVGLAIALSDYVIKDSMWDMLALMFEAMGYAMLRHKEEKIFKEFQNHLHPVFDNASTNSKLWTRGRAINQTANYTATFDDFVDGMGGLVANEYIPTDFIMHPLAWVIFAKDPILRNVMFTQSQIGQSIWTQTPNFDQSVNVPWNVSYQVTPFVPFSLETTLSTGPASGLATCNISDIYIVDRQNCGVVLQREDMEMDQFEDPHRDITRAKVRERYGVGTLNGGRAGVAIKNVRLEQNFAPINAIYNVTPPS